MFLEAQSSRVPWPPSGLPSGFSTPKNIRKVLEDLFATASILGTTDDETPRQSASSTHLSVSLPFPPVKRCRSSTYSSNSSGRRRSNKLTCCTRWSGGQEGFPVRWRCSSIERRWRWRRRRCRPFGWHPSGRHAQESRAWWRNGIGDL